MPLPRTFFRRGRSLCCEQLATSRGFNCSKVTEFPCFAIRQLSSLSILSRSNGGQCGVCNSISSVRSSGVMDRRSESTFLSCRFDSKTIKLSHSHNSVLHI